MLLPMLVELAPAANNKEIYISNLVSNTIVTIEPPRVKRNIPQCREREREIRPSDTPKITGIENRNA